MKAKAKKSTSKKVVVPKRVVAQKNSNTSWIIGVLVVLALVAMWQFNKPAMQPQSLDINKVETGVVQEHEVAKWTFDSEADFGTNGVWRVPAAYRDYKGQSLQGGQVVWSNLLSDVQLVAPAISLNLPDIDQIAGSYVIKVKADYIEQMLTKRNEADPTATVNSPHNFTMKVALIRLVKNNKGINEEQILATPTVSGTTNSGMKEYELVIPRTIKANPTRIRLYPYTSPTLSKPVEKSEQKMMKSRTTFYLDEVKVVLRKDAIPGREDRPERSAYPKRTPMTQRSPDARTVTPPVPAAVN